MLNKMKRSMKNTIVSDQFNTNIKFLTEYEYIRKKKSPNINIEISRQLTEYDYRVYLFLTT